MQLDLHIDEISTILTVLGDLPTKTGLYPLAMKIKEQAEAQLPAPAPAVSGEVLPAE